MPLALQVVRSIHELNQIEWDEFRAGNAFQSHLWYAFGEKVMGDRKPTYLIVRQADRMVAGATLWRIHDEPLPLAWGLQAGLHFFFRRRPLLICRSPLADKSGLMLPNGPIREEAQALLIAAARQELRRQRGSFLLFDFLGTDGPNLPHDFKLLSMASPGTRMEIQWPSFQAYLQQRKQHGRWHYRKTIEEAGQRGLKLTKQRAPGNAGAAQALIENVFRKHEAPFSPWMRAFLENLGMVDGTWMEVRQGDRLVGCAAAIRDQGVQLGTALGLEQDIPYAYFLLMYAIVEEAFEHQIKTLRLGSGAYEFKRRLGFVLEDNNRVGVMGAGSLSRWLTGLAVPGS